MVANCGVEVKSVASAYGTVWFGAGRAPFLKRAYDVGSACSRNPFPGFSTMGCTSSESGNIFAKFGSSYSHIFKQGFSVCEQECE